MPQHVAVASAATLGQPPRLACAPSALRPPPGTAGAGIGSAATCCAAVALATIGAFHCRDQLRGGRHRATKRRRRIAVRCAATAEQGGLPRAQVKPPENLYELLSLEDDADKASVKHAYHEKMKMCHPDVAGDDAAEMCMLLSSAYEVLSDSKDRAQYNEQVRAARGDKSAVVRYADGDNADQSPTWKWQPKVGNKKTRPTYTGMPYSRSRWDRAAPESRGQQWEEEKFVFVDEWSCIACRNCCDVAPRTFCIDMDAGRARVFCQWADYEDDLSYAVQACPVDCIHWVNREDLQVLEFVTRQKLYDIGNTLPCPMAIRHGNAPSGSVHDPFELAMAFKARQRDMAPAGHSVLSLEAAKLRERISTAFEKLSDTLQLQGWGGFLQFPR